MASVPTDHDGLGEAPLGGLLRSLLADVRLLSRREAELALVEVKLKASRLGLAGGLMAGAVLVAVFALGTLITAAVLGLAIVLPAWAAALVVGVALVAVAATLFLVGRARMKTMGPLAPTETIQTLREDVSWIRQETDRLRATE
jgi:putative superfamily III holin-X